MRSCNVEHQQRRLNRERKKEREEWIYTGVMGYGVVSVWVICVNGCRQMRWEGRGRCVMYV